MWNQWVNSEHRPSIGIRGADAAAAAECNTASAKNRNGVTEV
jgi:hypothetical protein